VQLRVLRDAERNCHPARGFDLSRVDLSIPDRESEEFVSVTRRNRARRVGVETSAQEEDGFHLGRRLENVSDKGEGKRDKGELRVWPAIRPFSLLPLPFSLDANTFISAIRPGRPGPR
jgi:hypothetical protein